LASSSDAAEGDTWKGGAGGGFGGKEGRGGTRTNERGGGVGKSERSGGCGGSGGGTSSALSGLNEIGSSCCGGGGGGGGGGVSKGETDTPAAMHYSSSREPRGSSSGPPSDVFADIGESCTVLHSLLDREASRGSLAAADQVMALELNATLLQCIARLDNRTKAAMPAQAPQGGAHEGAPQSQPQSSAPTGSLPIYHIPSIEPTDYESSPSLATMSSVDPSDFSLSWTGCLWADCSCEYSGGKCSCDDCSCGSVRKNELEASVTALSMLQPPLPDHTSDHTSGHRQAE
jgi:hypothetical protein